EWMTRLALTPCVNAVVPHALYGFGMHSGSLSSNPETFSRIIQEHLMLAEALLARPDLTEAQRQTVLRWRQRQAAYGMWRALGRGKFDEARDFLRRGLAFSHWPFIPFAFLTLARRLIRKLALAISGGIDRG